MTGTLLLARKKKLDCDWRRKETTVCQRQRRARDNNSLQQWLVAEMAQKSTGNYSSAATRVLKVVTFFGQS